MSEPNPIGILGIYPDSSSAPSCQAAFVIFTNRSWAERVLQYLNELTPSPMTPIPLTTNNIDNLTRWMQAENRIPENNWWGNPTATSPNRTNPLNSGEGPPNGNPRGTYYGLDQAAYYVAKLLLYGPPWANYGAIVSALQGDENADVFSAAVVQSSFEGTRYGVKVAIDAYNAKNPPKPIPDSDVVPNRGLNFMAAIAAPPETPAPASHGRNPSTTNGVGWDWASPQAWQPNPGRDFPGEPDMSPVPPLVSIDPNNLATYNSATGFGPAPSSSGVGSGGGTGSPPTSGTSSGTPIGDPIDPTGDPTEDPGDDSNEDPSSGP